MTKKGIDVSVWNGNIDWSQAAKEIDFAILRAGYGKISSQKDSKFDVNYSGCKNNGVQVGIYWYNYAKTVEEAQMEARACLSAIGGRKFDMPVWYDIEENSVFATGKNNVSAIAEAFLTIIAEAGYKVGIYSSYSALQTYFTDEVKNKYDVWLAHVGNGGAPLSSTSYPGKKQIWQYSWTGKVAGISGDVDMDYCYVEYKEEEKKPEVTPAPVGPSKPVEPAKPVTPAKPVEPAKPAVTENIDIIYGSYIGRWLGEIKNCNDKDTNGYSGIDMAPISGVTAKATKGTLKYRVHVLGGGWLGWISASNRNDWNKGVAGIKSRYIDGIQFDLTGVPGYKVQYRVSTINGKQYLPWVTGWDNTNNGYAGIYGTYIDKIQAKIVKA